MWQKGGLATCMWQEKAEKKPVKFLSSNFNPMEPETLVKRKQHDGALKEMSCPLPLKCYNDNMDGVDRSDQMRTAYLCGRMSKRWWTYLLWFLVDLCISNALILMCESENHQMQTKHRKENVPSVLEYRKKLAVQLLGEDRCGGKRKKGIRRDMSRDGHWPKKSRGQR